MLPFAILNSFNLTLLNNCLMDLLYILIYICNLPIIFGAIWISPIFPALSQYTSCARKSFQDYVPKCLLHPALVAFLRLPIKVNFDVVLRGVPTWTQITSSRNPQSCFLEDLLLWTNLFQLFCLVYMESWVLWLLLESF